MPISISEASPTHPAAAQSQSDGIERGIELAATLQRRAIQLQSEAERRQQESLARMLDNPKDKTTLTQITDQSFRSRRAARMADQLGHVLDLQGVPRFFDPIERTTLRVFQSLRDVAPSLTMPLVEARIRKETTNVILPAEHGLLDQHLEQRRVEGVRMNVNLLGEAILGEDEALHRLQANLTVLQKPGIEVISVKISTIYSQISALAREHTIKVLCDRMEILYRSASRLSYVRSDGTSVPKFVYLDMEEYRDMDLTAEVFMRTLDRPGMAGISAGIVLQAYIPDSFAMMRRLQDWARQRSASGGAPITIRIVKGANMEMERVEASVRGWPQAPFLTKRETDANFTRMLHEGLRKENRGAVHLGIASHNLLHIGYALSLATELGELDRIHFEMLEGMANHQRRALAEHARNLLLYAPACTRDEFLNAVGYLIRRLDENTSPDNFLRRAFRLQVGSDDWRSLVAGFRASFDLIPTLGTSPRRTQNRATERHDAPLPEMALDGFRNEPDTDFSLPHNSAWADAIVTRWQARVGQDATEIPLVIAGETITDGRPLGHCEDPSRPHAVVGRWRQASDDDVAAAVRCAKADPDGWRTLGADRRSAILGDVSRHLRAARGDLIGAAMADGGKTLIEADPEVSEAIDFCEFYRASARSFFGLPDVQAHGKGVVVVVSPWNFPIAIPCGGIAAALAAGNTVILKPASDSVLVAWELCQCFWRAGVSQRTLQFLPCSGSGPGRKLVSNPDVDAVILTGGTDTALAMLRNAPSMDLYAETGGKNATIVTAMADREQAIKHVVHSAFSHSGQKCSATSLLLLEAEIYDDPAFQRMLCDAVRSLSTGPVWQLQHRIGPLIRPPSGDLETALKTLEPGESWALLPRCIDGNPRLWSPGIKWGVQRGSFTHKTEFFGPILGVIRFERLEDAIEIVNETGYGLTSGLETLDDREQSLWLERIRAGNLYINRPTTGAIVLRQPFGGMGKSSFGPGLKAGGPNYVAQFMRFETSPTAKMPQQPLSAVLAAIKRVADEEFKQLHDHFRLIGQDNIRRYLPVSGIVVRLHPEDTETEVAIRVACARIAGCRFSVSSPASCADTARRGAMLGGASDAEIRIESDDDLAVAIRSHKIERLRFANNARVPMNVRLAAAETGTCICDASVVPNGRVELLWYFLEQSISDDYHRYGNLGSRSGESSSGSL